MSDPLRDHAANKREQKRERVRSEYTPLVVWVKCPENERDVDVLNYIQRELGELPYLTVATKHAPYDYAESGVLRAEDADGNGGDE